MEKKPTVKELDKFIADCGKFFKDPQNGDLEALVEYMYGNKKQREGTPFDFENESQELIFHYFMRENCIEIKQCYAQALEWRAEREPKIKLPKNPYAAELEEWERQYDD